MNAALLLFGFAAMCVLPLLPGLLEVLRPRDRYPLPVDLAYAKDPRYLGNSLRALLGRALASDLAAGEHELELSRRERVRLTGDHRLAAGEACGEVLVVRGDLRADEGASCEREVHVHGTTDLADRVGLRALAGDRDVRFGRGVTVLRWLDAAGDLRAGADCRLGRHCAAGGALELADGCRFARLFGAPITTPGGASRLVPQARWPRPVQPRPDRDAPARTIDEVLHYERGDLAIAAGRTIERDLVVHGDLVVEAGATIAGSMRVHGGARLGEGVLLLGSLFADGPIDLGPETTVAGNVFGQDTVTVGPGTQIGRQGAVKSLIGNRGVTLGEKVVVHGYVLTEGEGVVRCAAG